MDRQPAREGFHQDVLVITLGITPGDPAGVGPELIEQCLALPWPDKVRFEVLGKDVATFVPGRPSQASARFAWDAMEEAACKLGNGEWQGVVTGPTCKAHLQEVGFSFPGQTEFFAARAGVDDVAMCLTGGPLTLALVTIHEPLAEVPRLLTTPEIVRVGSLLVRFLHQQGKHPIRMAVAGLNPHAGEAGHIGREEITIIAPAIQELRTRFPGADISDPIAPDSVFRATVAGRWDGVLCMYHDQGLIPFKMVAFDEGVNTTLGLPFVRTSPDHGTAFDLAGKGLARPDSFRSAMRLAVQLCLARG